MTDQPNTNTISVEEQANGLRALVVNVMNDRLPAWWEPMGSFLFDEEGRLYEIAVLPKGELERLREEADSATECHAAAHEAVADHARHLATCEPVIARQAALIDAIESVLVQTTPANDIARIRSLIAAHKKSTEAGS